MVQTFKRWILNLFVVARGGWLLGREDHRARAFAIKESSHFLVEHVIQEIQLLVPSTL
jgi:hypothetical protein